MTIQKGDWSITFAEHAESAVSTMTPKFLIPPETVRVVMPEAWQHRPVVAPDIHSDASWQPELDRYIRAVVVEEDRRLAAKAADGCATCGNAVSVMVITRHVGYTEQAEFYCDGHAPEVVDAP